MKKVGIVTDSRSGITQKQAKRVMVEAMRRDLETVYAGQVTNDIRNVGDICKQQMKMK